MNKTIVTGCAILTAFAAVAMPTKKELAAAQRPVENATSADLKALRAGTVAAKDVAHRHLDLAGKAGNQAEKYLLYQGAFKLYARCEDYDAAAAALAAMDRDVEGVSFEVIAELVDKEMHSIAGENAARVLAKFKEAKRSAKRGNVLAAAQPAKPKDAAVGRDTIRIPLSPDCEMTFCPCPAGSFTMGYEECPALSKVREVRISRPFWITRTPLTARQVEALGVKATAETNGFAKFANHRTLGIELAAKLKQKYPGIPKGYVFRLPTEAELEYVIKAGTKPGDPRRKWGFADEKGAFTHPWGLSSEIYRFPMIVCLFDRAPKGGGNKFIANRKNGKDAFWTELVKASYENQPLVDPLGWSDDPAWCVLRRGRDVKLNAEQDDLISNNDYYVIAPEEKLLNKFCWECDKLYCVIDVSGGANAKSYPVTYLDAEPKGGWTKDDRTKKIVLRRMNAGRDPQGRYSISSDFYIGVSMLTQKQWEMVTGKKAPPSAFNNGDDEPAGMISMKEMRGVDGGNGIGSDGFAAKLAARTGLAGFDLPTEAQWEYAACSGKIKDFGFYWERCRDDASRLAGADPLGDISGRTVANCEWDVGKKERVRASTNLTNPKNDRGYRIVLNLK